MGSALTIGAATVASVAVLARCDMPESAAVILGALDSTVIWSFITSGYMVLDVNELRREVAGALGNERFESEHARGASMQYPEAIDFVRESLRGLTQSLEA